MLTKPSGISALSFPQCGYPYGGLPEGQAQTFRRFGSYTRTPSTPCSPNVRAYKMTPKSRNYVWQDVTFDKFKGLVGSATLAAFKVAYPRKQWLGVDPRNVDQNHHLYVLKHA